MGTRILQADSGSDSESRHQNDEIIPVNRLTPTVWVYPPEPATTIRIPALLNKGHSLRRLSESESEPESACTTRVPFDCICMAQVRAE